MLTSLRRLGNSFEALKRALDMPATGAAVGWPAVSATASSAARSASASAKRESAVVIPYGQSS